MNELLSNFLRGSTSTVMYLILLITLTKTKYGRKGTIIIVSSVFILHLGSVFWFYLYGDLTSLSRFTVILFIVVGLAMIPLTRLNFMQWCFTYLTTINIGAMIIVLSFHLGRLFAHPDIAHIVIRILLYLLVILIFQRFLLPSYRSVINNWPVFAGLMISVFLNFAFYFFVTDDIKQTLTDYKWPLLLLVTLSVAAYGTVFFALSRFAALRTLEAEHARVRQESGRLHDEAMKLEEFANYDMLTKLPNRRFFFERLDRVVKEYEKGGNRFALLYLDLDGFKDINDIHGHAVGDKVLVTVGNRLAKGIRKTDFVARLGGDEFALIILDIEETAMAKSFAAKIRELLQADIPVDAIVYKINASIGIALYPNDGKDGETLLKNADAAMYREKRSARSDTGSTSGENPGTTQYHPTSG